MPQPTEPLSNVDAAWLNMDDPTNLMMVSGIMTFRRPLNLDHLMAVVRYRLLKFDRFRQRVVRPRTPLGAPYWEIDPNFDLKAHVRRIALPAPGDQATLQELVSDLLSTPLDPSKPLWQLHIIENYGQGSAIFMRIHHSIADGMALIFVLLSLTDMTPDAPWPESAEVIEERPRSANGGALFSLVKQVASATGTALGVTGKVLNEGWTAVNDSNHALELLQTGADYSYAFSKLLLRTSDPLTPFKGDLGVMKRAAWSRPLSLRDVKRVKNATKTTVNDVLIAAMVGGIRRYMLEQGAEVADFRATVPVNLRRPEEMSKMGNKFGLVFLTLPVSVEDPLERLDEVHLRMVELKNSPEAIVALGVLNVIGPSPTEIQSLIVKTFATKATAVMTNVPGPPMPLFMAGSEIDDLMFWVPQSGRLGLGVSILSYAGKVYLGVATDARLVPDPERIIDGFYKEFALLQEATAPPEAFAGPGPQSPARRARTRPDDLRQIEGIGPKAAAALATSGITTFEQLANASYDELRHALDAAGPGYQHMDPSDWPSRARAQLGR